LLANFGYFNRRDSLTIIGRTVQKINSLSTSIAVVFPVLYMLIQKN